MNNSDRLYERAVAFKKSKPWELLGEDCLFIVHSADVVCYCYMAGQRGDEYGLYVMPGEAGLNAWRAIFRATRNPEATLLWDVAAMRYGLGCGLREKDGLTQAQADQARAWARRAGVILAGLHAFPLPLAYEPGTTGRSELEPAEQELLCDCLEAAAWLKGWAAREKRAAQVREPVPRYQEGATQALALRRAGDGWQTEPEALPPETPTDWPEPVITNDLLAARLRHLHKEGTYEMRACYTSPALYSEMEGDGEPEDLMNDGCTEGDGTSLPFGLFAFSRADGVMGNPLLLENDLEPELLMIRLANACVNQGEAPMNIEVEDDRTEALLRGVCRQTGIQLTRVKALPNLTPEAILEAMALTDEDYYDDYEDDDEADEDHRLPEFLGGEGGASGEEVAFFRRLPSEVSVDTLRLMPKEIRNMYQFLTMVGLIDPEGVNRLRQAGVLKD